MLGLLSKNSNIWRDLLDFSNLHYFPLCSTFFYWMQEHYTFGAETSREVDVTQSGVTLNAALHFRRLVCLISEGLMVCNGDSARHGWFSQMRNIIKPDAFQGQQVSSVTK